MARTVGESPLNKTVQSLSIHFFIMAAFYAVLSVAIIFLYQETFRWLCMVWLDEREYSHGFLVPLVSAYLIWIKRKELSIISARPSYLFGTIFLCLGAILYTAGHAGAFIQVEAISLLIMLPAVVLFLGGWKFIKILSLPLAYLWFMLPLLDFIAPLSEKIGDIYLILQLISARIGVLLLSFTGCPVLSNDVYIQLPKITLEVAKECSGLNFLISIVALGIPLTYVCQRSVWRGVAVVLSSILIAILSNGARVAVAGFLGNEYGPVMLHGPYHILSGWIIAQIGVMGLFIVNWAVAKIPFNNAHAPISKLQASASPNVDFSFFKKQTAVTYSVLVLFFICMGAYAQLAAMPNPTALKQMLFDFPLNVGKWRGIPGNRINNESFFPGADSELNRIYRDDQGRVIHFYIGYFEYQQTDKRLIDVPSRILHENAQKVSLNYPFKNMEKANRTVLETSDGKYEIVFFYWFPSHGVTGRNMAKLITMVNVMLHRENNAAAILFAMPIYKNDDRYNAFNEINEFINLTLPLIEEYLPSGS